MTLPSRKHAWPPVWSRGQSPRQLRFSRAVFSHLHWIFRPAALRSTSGPIHQLFAGPWVGEFGWELMNWQAALRALRPRVGHLTVCARASSQALYDDFCDEFIAHDIRGTSNTHAVFDIENPRELDRILKSIPAHAVHLPPQRYIPRHAQHFIPFGMDAPKDGPELLIHARGNPRDAHRNWSADLWSELVQALGQNGIGVGSIGLSDQTCEVAGVEDFRDLPLKQTLRLMAGARCVLGPSSGPLHLASLCRTPHVVWTDQRTYGMGKTSREKYESWWNPLKTPVHVIDEYEFQPPVSVVLEAVEKQLI